MEYSNPRKKILFQDWPYGNKRCKCLFIVEENKGRERATKTTTNPKNNLWNKVKKATYSYGVLFMDGDDGRTYIVNDTGFAISIFDSSMKLQHEYFGKEDERYDAIMHHFNHFTTASEVLALEDYQGMYEQDGAETLEFTVRDNHPKDIADAILNLILGEEV